MVPSPAGKVKGAECPFLDRRQLDADRPTRSSHLIQSATQSSPSPCDKAVEGLARYEKTLGKARIRSRAAGRGSYGVRRHIHADVASSDDCGAFGVIIGVLGMADR